VYLGSEYVNNPTLADITFNVEGRKFYAHRIALLASSEAFRAMFSGGYRVSSYWIGWKITYTIIRLDGYGGLLLNPYERTFLMHDIEEERT
jgi:hypothetical protein